MSESQEEFLLRKAEEIFKRFIAYCHDNYGTGVIVGNVFIQNDGRISRLEDVPHHPALLAAQWLEKYNTIKGEKHGKAG